MRFSMVFVLPGMLFIGRVAATNTLDKAQQPTRARTGPNHCFIGSDCTVIPPQAVRRDTESRAARPTGSRPSWKA